MNMCRVERVSRAFPGLVILVALLSAGCDGSAAYRDLLRDQAKALDELSGILTRVSDKDSMEAARTQLAAHYREFDSLSRRFQELDRPTPEVMRAMNADWAKANEAMKKVHAQVRRINALPEGKEFLASFDTKGVLAQHKGS